MHYTELFDTLQKLINYRPTAVQISKILDLSKKAMYARQQRNSKFSDEEIDKIYEFYKLDRYVGFDVKDTSADKVEITYYQNPNLKTEIRVPLLTSLWFDRELVENIWKRKPENLRVIKMLGDKMDYGQYPLKNNDILIMDISDTDAFNSGIYAFTTHDDNYIFINNVNRKYDGSYKFTFLNPKYPDKIYSMEECQNFGLRIVGRVIKNLSLIL